MDQNDRDHVDRPKEDGRTGLKPGSEEAEDAIKLLLSGYGDGCSGAGEAWGDDCNLLSRTMPRPRTDE